jgi:tetratricopeptide (TPR) repeat protein
MEGLSGKLSQETALSVVRRLALDLKTGILTLRDGSVKERLYFVSGDLYLEPDHPLALALRPASSSDHAALGDQDDRDRGLSEAWLTQAVLRLTGWRAGEFEFVEDPTAISTDLVGPLSTPSILMAGAVHGLDEFRLLRSLGGEDRQLVVVPGNRSALGERVALDPQEAFFLSRLEQPVAVKELVRQASQSRFESLKRLCRLTAVGLICPEDELPEEPQASLLPRKLLERFAARIGESLEREPLELGEAEQRRRIVNLLSRLGGLTYFELLGTGVGANAEEIHARYTDLARIVHPSHAERLGLSGKEAGLHLLFEKATQAYLTLSDEDRSRQYLQEVGALTEGGFVAPSEESRQRELLEVADRNYRTAKAMVAREEYHFAVELLLQTVRMYPKAEYYELLGRCQAMNPRWLSKAVASYGRAVQLDPESADLRVGLGRALEKSGNLHRAREEYEAALERMPGHPEAKAALGTLGSGRKGEASGGEKWWQSLLKLKRPGGS